MKISIDPNHLIQDLAMDIPFITLSTKPKSTWLSSNLRHPILKIGDTHHKVSIQQINNENRVNS